MHAKTLIHSILLALFAPAAAAVAQDAHETRLAHETARAIRTHPQLTIFDDVNVHVQDGVVTLSGKVTVGHKRDSMGRAVERIDGVREVRNQIGVLAASPYDDELRHRIARAIYGNPAFWSYASMAAPPIHVIVEGGRVTLTGVVSSDVERALARSLATGRGELSVTNELRVEHAKR